MSQLDATPLMASQSHPLNTNELEAHAQEARKQHDGVNPNVFERHPAANVDLAPVNLNVKPTHGFVSIDVVPNGPIDGGKASRAFQPIDSLNSSQSFSPTPMTSASHGSYESPDAVAVPVSVVAPLHSRMRIPTVASELTSPGVELKISRSLEVELRVHDAVLGHFFALAARELEATPVVDDKHASVQLSDVVIKPVVGGVSFACAFHATVTSSATRAFGVEPTFHGRMSITSSPLWIESGTAHIRVCAIEVAAGEEYSTVVRKSFNWLRDKMRLQDALQAKLQQFAREHIDGHKLLDIAQNEAHVDEATLRRVRSIVNPDSARGSFKLTTGEKVVLEVTLQPTRHARRMLYGTVAGVTALIVLLIIIIAVAVAKTA